MSIQTNPIGVELVIKAAQLHGENSEPDHEVGDLQDALRLMWAMLTPEQKIAFAEDEATVERIENEMPSGFDVEQAQAALRQELATVPHDSTWRARVNQVCRAASALPIVFSTSLTDATGDLHAHRVHTGEDCWLAGVIIEPGPFFDEEVLPFYLMKFGNGELLQVAPNELFSRDERFLDLQSAVCGPFAVARDMGFLGPHELSREGTAQQQLEFAERLGGFRVTECEQAFNTPAEFRTGREQQRG